MEIQHDARVRLRTSDLSWREVDREIIALVISSATYLAFNGSAVLLWRRLSEGAVPSELAGDLVASYDIPVDVAMADACAFLEQLRSSDLLEPCAD